MKAFYGSGALLTFLYFYQGRWSLLPILQKSLLVFFLAQVIYAQFLVLYPFYPSEARGPGIQLQFQKALVPIAYIWPLTMILLWIKPFTAFFFLMNLLLIPMSGVASILLYFHYRDPDPSSPNELSGSHTPRS